MEEIKFSKEEIKKMNASGYREALIENNLYAIQHKKIHINKKKYNRKHYKIELY